MPWGRGLNQLVLKDVELRTRRFFGGGRKGLYNGTTGLGTAGKITLLGGQAQILSGGGKKKKVGRKCALHTRIGSDMEKKELTEQDGAPWKKWGGGKTTSHGTVREVTKKHVVCG